MKTPLAWLQLAHEKTRLAVALAGIGFADMLMFVQLGFQAALFDSNLRLPSNLDADIVLLNSQTKAILSIQSFSSRRLYQSLSVPGVQSVSPLYLSFALWKNPINRQTRQLMVIGMNPEDQVLNLPGVAENINKIKLPDTYLFDDQSRAEFGPVAQLINEGKNVTTEVNERKITVEGLFTLGASFSADGNVITSDINFIRLFKRNKGLIDLGLVKVEPGADVNQIVSQLKQKFPEDIRVLTKEEFKDFEKQYWQNSTSIGFVFSLGTAIGFVVGIVIVYQILYTGVADHLPEYATLKAMGYKDTYFIFLVFQQAIILALVGYLPGYLIAIGLYGLAAGATSLPIIMSLSRAIVVLILTVIMCCFSGGIAVRKLSAADPADIF